MRVRFFGTSTARSQRLSRMACLLGSPRFGTSAGSAPSSYAGMASSTPAGSREAVALAGMRVCLAEFAFRRAFTRAVRSAFARSVRRFGALLKPEPTRTWLLLPPRQADHTDVGIGERMANNMMNFRYNTGGHPKFRQNAPCFFKKVLLNKFIWTIQTSDV